MTRHAPPSDRRHFLGHGTRLAVRTVAAAAATTTLAGLAATPARAAGPVAGGRALALTHTHTGERIELVYAQADRYLDDALGALNRFLRDHYTGTVGVIDPGLFDLLHRVHAVLGSRAAYEVVSGFRSAQTNERLRRTGGGGVAARSLHMDGQAIDVRLPGVALRELRDAALSLRAGGVGFYPGSRFVHLDVGRVRRW